MKLTVKKSNFLRELSLVQGVVERRSTVPMLSNLLLETAKDGVWITATDLDVTLQTVCPAAVTEGGAWAVPARKLFDIVRLLPESDLALELIAGKELRMTSANSTFKLVGLPKDDFPAIPTPPWSASPSPRQEAAPAKTVAQRPPITLAGSVVRTMITRTIFAITQDESRYTLSGALALLQPGSMTMVATDGHRLALISTRTGIEGVSEDLRVLIPKKALGELLKLVSDEVPIAFGKDENHLFFEIGSRRLVARTLAGQFPNYEMVIPKENDKAVAFNTVALATAIRRVMVLADERSHAIKLVLNRDHAEVTASSSDAGEAREVVPLSVAAGAAAAPSKKADSGHTVVEFGFNGQYLLDFLTATGSESVSFAFKDNETQLLLRPIGDETFAYDGILMPMRL